MHSLQQGDRKGQKRTVGEGERDREREEERERERERIKHTDRL